MIWFIHGTYHPRKKLGRVADYCPGCRDIVPLTIEQLKEVSHLYFIPLGRGRIVDHESTCPVCKLALSVDTTDYRELCTDPAVDLDAMIERTHPDILETRGEQIDLADRLTRGEITEKERRSLIRESLSIMEPQLRRHQASVHFDRIGVIVMLVPLGTLIPVWIWAIQTRNHPSNAILITWCCLVALSVAALVWAAKTECYRWVIRKLHPNLILLLTPLKPTDQELSEVLADMMKNQKLAGRYIKVGKLRAALRAADIA